MELPEITILADQMGTELIGKRISEVEDVLEDIQIIG